MKPKNMLLHSAIASLLALGIAQAAAGADDANSKEKCYGIAKAGQNDCGTARHLDRLAALVRRFEPALVSEHLSWSSIGGRHANELLPLPFTEEALDHVVASIGRVQDRIGRRIFVENVSAYFRFPESSLPEW